MSWAVERRKKNKDIAVGEINGRTEGRHAAETRGASRHNVAQVTQERGLWGGDQEQGWEKTQSTRMMFLSNKISVQHMHRCWSSKTGFSNA